MECLRFADVPGVTGGDLCWSPAVAVACRGCLEDGPVLPGPLVSGPFRDHGRKLTSGRHGRRGGDGEVLGDGAAGPGGRDRGPGGGGAGGGAGRPGGAVRRAGVVGRGGG